MLLPCPYGTKILRFHDVLGHKEKFLRELLGAVYLSKYCFEVVGTLMNAKSTSLPLKQQCM